MRQRDGGFTVIEMIVAITLSGIVGGMATTVIVQGFHQQAATDARTAAVSNVRTAFQRVMRELRGGYLTNVTGSSVTFTDYTRTQTKSYLLQTANGTTSLMVSVNSATPTPVITNIVNDASQPVFAVLAASSTYIDTTGTVNTQTCVISGQTPTAYAPQCVGVLAVHLRVMPTSASGGALCTSTSGCVIDVSDAADVRNNQ